MENDNVVSLPGKLERLSKRIKKNMEVGHKIRAEWIDSKIEMACDLREARLEFGKNDRAFHNWLVAEGLGDSVLPRHDRIALIAMASDPERMRTVFKTTTRWSPQHIHQEEWNVASREATSSDVSLHKETSNRRRAPSPGVDKARNAVRTHVQESGEAPTAEVAKALNLNQRTVQHAVLVERSYFEGIEDGKAIALKERLTKAQAHHIERLIKIEAKRLARELAEERAKLHAEVKATVDRQTEATIKYYNEQYEKSKQERETYRKLINGHKPPLTPEEYRVLVMVFHSDDSAPEEKKKRAFQIVTDKKLQLTGKP